MTSVSKKDVTRIHLRPMIFPLTISESPFVRQHTHSDGRPGLAAVSSDVLGACLASAVLPGSTALLQALL